MKRREYTAEEINRAEEAIKEFKEQMFFVLVELEVAFRMLAESLTTAMLRIQELAKVLLKKPNTAHGPVVNGGNGAFGRRKRRL